MRKPLNNTSNKSRTQNHQTKQRTNPFSKRLMHPGVVDVIVIERRRREERDENEEEEDGGGNDRDNREKPIDVLAAPPGMRHEAMAAGLRTKCAMKFLNGRKRAKRQAYWQQGRGDMNGVGTIIFLNLSWSFTFGGFC